MELNKTNSLVELFFEKYKEKKELKNQPFLKWLKTNKNDFLTWDQVKNTGLELNNGFIISHAPTRLFKIPP